MKTTFKIKPGDTVHHGQKITDGEICITGTGKLTYIWIGSEKGPCFGHLSGPKTLEALAKNILTALKKNK